MKAYVKLICAGFTNGFTRSVYDGGEWQVKRSRSLSECLKAVKSVDEAELRFRDADGKPVGWALVSDAADLLPDETVIDCTCCDWIDAALAF